MTQPGHNSTRPRATPKASADPEEIEKFSKLASEWWDLNGKFAPLHRFNPIRLKYIRDQGNEHFRRDPALLRPFEGLTLLDIGCGGGLVSEPMARIGFTVLGADASERNIGTAASHAEGSGLPLSYRCTTAEALAAEGATFDVVLNLEVVEHVAEVGPFLSDCAKLVKPGGIMMVATMDRTLKSLALAKIGAEYVLGWLPQGTHDWNKFVRPGELIGHLSEAGLSLKRLQGIAFNPLRWEWELSSDTDVNYVAVAEKR